jgi:hypothetical protein
MLRADSDALEETAYLLRSPANARHLVESLEQARRGERPQPDLASGGRSSRRTDGPLCIELHRYADEPGADERSELWIPATTPNDGRGGASRCA